MYTEHNLKERCKDILEKNGREVADQSSKILFEDPNLEDLHEPLKLIAENWRDPLTPALMSLSCEAVGGQPKNTHKAALSLSLINLSFYVWDNMLDKSRHKTFKPTIFGKFGEGTALIIGGLASAKAFSIFNELDLDPKKCKTINKTVWNLWTTMTKAEKVNLSLSGQSPSSDKLWVIKTESVDLETCLKIGAILGDGSSKEVNLLGKYGTCLGVVFDLWKDFLVSINLRLDLSDKISANRLTYSLLWAKEQSKTVQKKLESLAKTDSIPPADIKEVVEQILATKTLENVTNLINESTEKAKACLSGLEANEATQALKFFVDAQPQLFSESLSVVQT